MLVAKTELSYYPEEVLEVKDKPKRNIRKKQIKKKRNNSIAKLVVLFLPMIILAVSLSILFRYANLTNIRREITRLEMEKEELEKVKMDLIGELEGLKSSVRIAEDAIIQLGMDYPTDEQVVYISVNDNSIEKAEEPTFARQLKKVFSMVTNLF